VVMGSILPFSESDETTMGTCSAFTLS
jgi:hypothetical protein